MSMTVESLVREGSESMRKKVTFMSWMNVLMRSGGSREDSYRQQAPVRAAIQRQSFAKRPK